MTLSITQYAEDRGFHRSTVHVWVRDLKLKPKTFGKQSQRILTERDIKKLDNHARERGLL